MPQLRINSEFGRVLVFPLLVVCLFLVGNRRSYAGTLKEEIGSAIKTLEEKSQELNPNALSNQASSNNSNQAAGDDGYVEPQDNYGATPNDLAAILNGQASPTQGNGNADSNDDGYDTSFADALASGQLSNDNDAELLRQKLGQLSAGEDARRILAEIGSPEKLSGEQNLAVGKAIKERYPEKAAEYLQAAKEQSMNVDFAMDDLADDIELALDDLKLAQESEDPSKLLHDAFQKYPSAQLASLAGLAYEERSDTVNAVAMYRQALGCAAVEGNDAVAGQAEAYLKEKKMTQVPTYEHTRSAAAQYLTNNGKSEYREESEPPNKERLKANIQALISRFQTGQASDAKVKDALTKVLGVEDSAGLDGWIAKISQAKDKEKDLVSFIGKALDERKVTYLKTDAAREQYRLSTAGDGQKDGRIYRDGKVMDTSAMSTNFAGPGWAIFVMSQDGEVFANSHAVNQFHHSSFFAGGDVASAGEVNVQDGRVVGITNKTGHYKAEVVHLVQALDRLEREFGQDLSGVTVQVFGADGKVAVWPDDAKEFKAQFLSDQAKFRQKLSQEFDSQNRRNDEKEADSRLTNRRRRDDGVAATRADNGKTESGGRNSNDRSDADRADKRRSNDTADNNDGERRRRRRSD